MIVWTSECEETIHVWTSECEETVHVWTSKCEEMVHAVELQELCTAYSRNRCHERRITLKHTILHWYFVFFVVVFYACFNVLFHGSITSLLMFSIWPHTDITVLLD